MAVARRATRTSTSGRKRVDERAARVSHALTSRSLQRRSLAIRPIRNRIASLPTVLTASFEGRMRDMPALEAAVPVMFSAC
jgi:hypothetical protein